MEGSQGPRVRTQPAGGFPTLSGILLARSGAPFNLNSGYDTIGDRHNDTHRPFGLGRNVGTGPSFFGLDLRLTRTFALSESLDMQVIAEGFNILNKTNFRTVNGNVGQLALEDVPARPKGRLGPVTEPYSFTSAFDPRQYQFTLRLDLLGASIASYQQLFAWRGDPLHGTATYTGVARPIHDSATIPIPKPPNAAPTPFRKPARAP